MQFTERAKARLAGAGRKLWNERKRRVWPKTQLDLEMSGISNTAWEARKEAPTAPDYPNAWRGHLPRTAHEGAGASSKLAVLVFLSAAEQFVEYRPVLSRIEQPHDLFVLGPCPAPSTVAALESRGAVFLPLEEPETPGTNNVGLGLLYLANAGAFVTCQQVLCLADPGEAERLIPDSQAAQDAGCALEGLGVGLVGPDSSISVLGSYDAFREGVQFLARRYGLQAVSDKARFVEGGTFWARAFLLQVLTLLDFSRVDLYPSYEWDLSKLTPTVARVIGTSALEADVEVLGARELRQRSGADRAHAMARETRTLALFEPAFARAPLDDRFWGRDYRPLANPFSDLGQERPQTIAAAQDSKALVSALVEAARKADYAGLTGFLMRSYWFSGNSVLSAPLDALLESPEIELPFALLWETGDWTAPFVGGVEQVSAGQDFNLHPASQYIESVLPALADPRYIRLGGRLLLVVSDASQVPDFPWAVSAWNERVKQEGLGELLVLTIAQLSVQGFRGLNGAEGFAILPPAGIPWSPASLPSSVSAKRFFGRFLSYRALSRSALATYRALRGRKSQSREESLVVIPGAMTAFDSWPSKNVSAEVWRGANPLAFRAWLRRTLTATAEQPLGDPVLLIRAWNDWASGSVMEPTKRWGLTYLQATRDLFGPTEGAEDQ